MLSSLKQLKISKAELYQQSGLTALIWFFFFECIQEKIQSHLQSLRKVLAEFLDWRASKGTPDYLVQGVPLALQKSEWVFGYLFFPKPLLKKHVGSSPRGTLKSPTPSWSGWCRSWAGSASTANFESISWHCSFSSQMEPQRDIC